MAGDTELAAGNVAEGLRARLADEVADVFLYLLRFADACGIDPITAAHDKITRNETRYPRTPHPRHRHQVHRSPTPPDAAATGLIETGEDRQGGTYFARTRILAATRSRVRHHLPDRFLVAATT
jgi:hypothetical protein